LFPYALRLVPAAAAAQQKTLADLAQASGSDSTRHKTLHAALRNQTKSKIRGGFFKCAPNEYSLRANLLPDACARSANNMGAGFRLKA
ncbi:MAG: hypothetical protein KGS49_07315, partial [Planctomycetes bacterium]|nr:hypothetical protein [Planctomycetota bacterium]